MACARPSRSQRPEWPLKIRWIRLSRGSALPRYIGQFDPIGQTSLPQLSLLSRRKPDLACNPFLFGCSRCACLGFLLDQPHRLRFARQSRLC